MFISGFFVQRLTIQIRKASTAEFKRSSLSAIIRSTVFYSLLFFVNKSKTLKTSDCFTWLLEASQQSSLNSRKKKLTLFRPGGGGGGLWRPYQNLKVNNFKAVKAMTTKFSDFS